MSETSIIKCSICNRVHSTVLPNDVSNYVGLVCTCCNTQYFNFEVLNQDSSIVKLLKKSSNVAPIDLVRK